MMTKITIIRKVMRATNNFSLTVSSSGTSVTWLGTSMPCTHTSLSTVNVTEQSRIEVFRQWGS